MEDSKDSFLSNQDSDEDSCSIISFNNTSGLINKVTFQYLYYIINN